MDEPRNFYQVIEGICAKDERYKSDAYEFTMQALHFTQQKLKRPGHLNGRELAEGMRDFAIEQYGPMAQTVLNHWGVSRTEDFGNIVFNLIEQKMLFRTETDTLEEFRDVYEFDAAFSEALRESILKTLKKVK
jgi:uncharacterized repeat protein (TIGR04138 family)